MASISAPGAGCGQAAANRITMEEFTPCSVCRRTPLIGEGMVVMANGRRESPLCELCVGRPRSEALGEPVRRERIRSAAGAANVRPALPAPLREPVARAIAS